MKVGFFDKRVRRKSLGYISAVFTFFSFVLTFTDFSALWRYVLLGLAIFLSLCIYFVVWCKANRYSKKNITINGNNIILNKSNIFDSKYNGDIKIIPCNEFFDTGDMINEKSINGQYLKKMLNDKVYSNIGGIDRAISESLANIKKGHVEVERLSGGKKERYDLGTICFLRDGYCLLAFTKFDENNRAILSHKDYISSLLNMWENLDITYNGKNIVIPLLGGGITRFLDSNNGTTMSNQELLKYLLYSLKLSGKTFKSNITIIVAHNNEELEKVNLFEIGEISRDI